MDEVSSRHEHRFASQRGCFESADIVVKHVHDVFNELLGQAHASVVDRGGNLAEEVGMLPVRPLPRRLLVLSFPGKRSDFSTKRPKKSCWTNFLAISEGSRCSEHARRLTIPPGGEGSGWLVL